MSEQPKKPTDLKPVPLSNLDKQFQKQHDLNPIQPPPYQSSGSKKPEGSPFGPGSGNLVGPDNPIFLKGEKPKIPDPDHPPPGVPPGARYDPVDPTDPYNTKKPKPGGFFGFDQFGKPKSKEEE